MNAEDARQFLDAIECKRIPAGSLDDVLEAMRRFGEQLDEMSDEEVDKIAAFLFWGTPE